MEFLLPDSKTGELTQPADRLWLKLPRPDAVIDGDYLEKDLRVLAQRVDLAVPAKHPKSDALAGCLQVESREDDRVHYHYYKEGKGLVAVEVYEMRQAPPAADAEEEPAKSGAAPQPAPAAAAPAGTANGTALKVLVYARYLIEEERRGAE
jgi:hypothetical protein